MGEYPRRSLDRFGSAHQGKLHRRYADHLLRLHVMLTHDAGNKKDNVTVIYTPWANLKKDGSMAVGQVSFKDPRKVRRLIRSSTYIFSHSGARSRELLCHRERTQSSIV